jgi:diketogulonate reductase-like aldo/keto reductase
MEELKEQGKVRLLGVSNVSLEQLALLCEKAEIKPAFVQNRCFAQLGWDYNIRSFCSENDIYYQGFSLLTANPMVLAHPGFQHIVQEREVTPAQLVFRFALQVGMLPLTGTTNPQHMREDLESYRFELSDKECEFIESCLVS